MGPNGAREMAVIIPTDQSRTTAQTNETGVYPVQVRCPHARTARSSPGSRHSLSGSRQRSRRQIASAPPSSSSSTTHRPSGPTRPTKEKSSQQNTERWSMRYSPIQTFRRHWYRLPSRSRHCATRSNADTALLDDVITIGQSDRQVLASTYVRLDASAWLASGLDEELTHQQLVGTAVLASMLPKADHRTWVADADLTPATLRHLRDSGMEQLVVPERSLAELDTAKFPESPTEPFKVDTDTGFPTPAVQIDSHLQSAFSRTSDPGLGANNCSPSLRSSRSNRKERPVASCSPRPTIGRRHRHSSRCCSMVSVRTTRSSRPRRWITSSPRSHRRDRTGRRLSATAPPAASISCERWPLRRHHPWVTSQPR